ncbi:MAG: hypothetical protein QXF82_03800 [Nitrososphaeria archaeon]
MSTQQIGSYDPWLDYNDDGRIDMKDIGITCRAFGTTGDPTKNVNITAYTTYSNYTRLHLDSLGYACLIAPIKGFRYVTVGLSVYSQQSVTITFNIMMKLHEGVKVATLGPPYVIELHSWIFLGSVQLAASTSISSCYQTFRTYQVQGTHIGIDARGPAGANVDIYIGLFMTT